MRTIILVASLAFAGVPAWAQQPPEKPRELGPIGRYVGEWSTDVTSKPAEWTPREIKYRCANHAEMIFDGWFLQHLEVNRVVGAPEQVTKAIWFQTFDKTSKKYVTWWFQSSGLMGKSLGTWDQANQSFHQSEVEPPPGTTHRFVERFRDEGTIDGSLSFTNNDGRKMFDMAWTRKRQAGVAGKPVKEQWGEIGTPIQPLPDEVKKLERFVGSRDVEFIHRPSVTAPQGSAIQGTMSGRWILDGRFLLGETKLPNFQSLWVIGYDTNKQAFRYLLFGSHGRIDENLGQWNEGERAFEWKQVDLAPELTRTSTTRLLDDGRIESRIVTKNQAGQTQLDLAIKATPRK